MLDAVVACDDDELYQQSLTVGLRHTFSMHCVSNAPHLLAYLQNHRCLAVLLDLRLGGALSGFDALVQIRRSWPRLPVIVHSGMADYSSIVKAMRCGAADYLPKSCNIDEVAAAVRQAIDRAQGIGMVSAWSQSEWVIQSPSMRRVVHTVHRFAAAQGNVLIRGESGVGKEHLAQLLRVAGKPFVAVDAATIHEATADSLLFGHVRGAFSGADAAHSGFFCQAKDGVLYLDEIGNLSLSIQAKLLRVLQEGEVRPLGSQQSTTHRCRVVSATNQDLEAMCGRGEFRADLLMRLDVLRVEVPPLRQRPEDIEPLLEYFLRRNGAADGLMSPEIRQHFCFYDWPGNVRELSNAVQYLLAMAGDDPADLSHLPPKMLVAPPGRQDLAPEHTAGAGRASLRTQMNSIERQLLQQAYERTNGQVAAMAKELKINRSYLYEKLKTHKIFLDTDS